MSLVISINAQCYQPISISLSPTGISNAIFFSIPTAITHQKQRNMTKVAGAMVHGNAAAMATAISILTETEPIAMYNAIAYTHPSQTIHHHQMHFNIIYLFILEFEFIFVFRVPILLFCLFFHWMLVLRCHSVGPSIPKFEFRIG